LPARAFRPDAPSLRSAAAKASSAARRFVPLTRAFSQPRPIRRDRTTRLGSLRASFLPGRFPVSGGEAAVAARCSYVGDSVLFFPPDGRVAIMRTEARRRRNRGGHTTDRSYRRRTDWSQELRDEAAVRRSWAWSSAGHGSVNKAAENISRTFRVLGCSASDLKLVIIQASKDRVRTTSPCLLVRSLCFQ
jgi:hypothetical protein